MKVTEASNTLRLPRDPNRSKGLHLSNVIRDLALKTGVLAAKYDTGPMEEESDDNELVHVGFAWEEYLAAKQYGPDVDFHPGEFRYQGIAMNCDAVQLVKDSEFAEYLDVAVGALLLLEIKTTAKSSRDFKDLLRVRHKKVRMYLWQIESYRYALNQICPDEACLTSMLDVLFVRGNYARDFSDPEAGIRRKVYVIHHTQDELETTWAMIQSHAECMRQEGKLGER